MNAIPVASLALPGHSRHLAEVRVTASADGLYHLSDGRAARPAVSCLVRPAVGDLALVTSEGEEAYILHILAREPGGSATLEVPGADEMRVEQHRISLLAREELALRSLRDLELAALGTLNQNATNQFVCVAQALIETLNQHVSRSRFCSQEASDLLTVHGGQTLMSADHDFRVDAERICMG